MYRRCTFQLAQGFGLIPCSAEPGTKTEGKTEGLLNQPLPLLGGWRDRPVVKNIYCSSSGPGLESQRPYDCSQHLYLQSQEIHHLLRVLLGTACTWYKDINADKTHIHIHRINYKQTNNVVHTGCGYRKLMYVQGTFLSSAFLDQYSCLPYF